MVTGKVSDVLENGGWDVATSKFGPKFRGIFSDKKKTMPDCFDVNHCLATVYVTKDSQGVLLAMPLTSVSKFESYIKKDSPAIYRTRTERGDMVFYQLSPEVYMVIHDDVLLTATNTTGEIMMPDEIVNGALARAAEHPLKGWQTDLLEQGNTLNALLSIAHITQLTTPAPRSP